MTIRTVILNLCVCVYTIWVFTSFPITSHHSPYFTSLHYCTFHHHASKTLYVSSLIITFLTLFLKICDWQVKDTSASAGNWFHSLTVLFTKEYLPISIQCFLALISWSWSSLLRQHGPINLSPIISMPVLWSMLWTGRKCELSFYAVPKFPRLNHSYALQI